MKPNKQLACFRIFSALHVLLALADNSAFLDACMLESSPHVFDFTTQATY